MESLLDTLFGAEAANQFSEWAAYQNLGAQNAYGMQNAAGLNTANQACNQAFPYSMLGFASPAKRTFGTKTAQDYIGQRPDWFVSRGGRR